MKKVLKNIILTILTILFLLVIAYSLLPSVASWYNERKPNYTQDLAIACWLEHNPNFVKDFYINPDNSMSDEIIVNYNKSVDILNKCRDTFNISSLTVLKEGQLSYEDLRLDFDPRYKK